MPMYEDDEWDWETEDSGMIDWGDEEPKTKKDVKK